MASIPSRNRPISPHLTIWKWGPHMLVSILHRVTGSGMATVGTLVLVWWLLAVAGGPVSYATFHFVFGEWASGLLGYVLGIGLTLSFFQHLASGVRHFFLDVGANYELRSNRSGAVATIVFSLAATVVVWAYILGFK